MEEDVDNKERLVNKYKNQVHIGKKTIDELVDLLKEKGAVVEMSKFEILPSALGNMIYNIKCSEKYKSSHPDEGEPDVVEHIKYPEKFMQHGEFVFLAYIFLQNDENKQFYENYKIPQEEYEDAVYVIFETRTERIYCNCTKLQLELWIFRGISEYDVENRTLAYFEHLFHLESLDNGWY